MGLILQNMIITKKGNFLLFLGKITEDKGVPDLLKALSILEDKKYYVPCVIGGCGKIEEMKDWLINTD